MTAGVVLPPPDVLGSIAAVGLSTETLGPDAPLDDASWSATLGHVRRHGLQGLLAAAVRRGTFPVTSEQYEEAAALHAAAATWVLLLERRLLTVADALTEAGIDLRVLKGPAVAALDYPDPAMRCFADVDLAVPGAQFGAAARILEALGGRRRFPEPRSGFDERFSKGASFRLRDGVEFDLHRTLCPGWFGLAVIPEDLFDSGTTFRLGGRELTALGATQRLVHACLHATLGDAHPRPLVLRDVAQMTLAQSSIDEVLALAHRWRCEVAVAHAVEAAWSHLRLTVEHPLLDWARSQSPGPAEIRRLAAYHGDGRSQARLALEAVGALHGVRSRARYLFAILAPRRDPDRLPTRARLRHGLAALRPGNTR